MNYFFARLLDIKFHLCQNSQHSNNYVRIIFSGYSHFKSLTLVSAILALTFFAVSCKTDDDDDAPTKTGIPEGFVKITTTLTPSSSALVSERSLYVCDHEVTRGEYKALIGSDPSTANAYDKNGNKLTGDNVLNNPVNYISWYAALVYCNKLSMKEGLTPCYKISNSTAPDDWGNVPTSEDDSTWNSVICNFKANGYRLPTETEWEWLARGGQDYIYAGSDAVNDVAWYTDNTQDTGSRDVKTKAANAYGLYDMSGNVWEWCWVPASNGISGAFSGVCARRGGSWFTNSNACAVTFSKSDFPHKFSEYTGFRIIRSVQ